MLRCLAALTSCAASVYQPALSMAPTPQCFPPERCPCACKEEHCTSAPVMTYGEGWKSHGGNPCFFQLQRGIRRAGAPCRDLDSAHEQKEAMLLLGWRWSVHRGTGQVRDALPTRKFRHNTAHQDLPTRKFRHNTAHQDLHC